MTESEQKTAVDIEQNWKDIQGTLQQPPNLQNDTRSPVSEGQLNMVTITTEDRLRGAMLDAANMLASGYVSMARKTLLDALRL